MKPIEFPEQNVVVAKDQPEYIPLPAYVSPGPTAGVTSCWELSPEDLAEVQRTGRVFVTQLTFGGPLQPVRLGTKFEPEP